MGLPKDESASSRVNLYEQIAGMLEERILSHNFKDQEKLPSEQELAEEFSVSRNVIREALKLLKERGLVESRNGTGSYITKPDGENLSDIINRMIVIDNIDYKDIYDVRIILEVAACKKAARVITPEEIEELEQLLEKLKDRRLTIEQRREMDFEFHVAIARIAGNPLLEIMVQAMKNIFIKMIGIGIFLRGGIEDAITRHASILDALKERNPMKAEEAMYNHLMYSRGNVKNYLDGKQEVPTSL